MCFAKRIAILIAAFQFIAHDFIIDGIMDSFGNYNIRAWIF